jgi:hypothetical protein
MNRWDPEPTSFQRWMVRHSKRVRLAAGVFMLLSICWMVYGLLTRGVFGALNGPILLVAIFGGILLDLRKRNSDHS